MNTVELYVREILNDLPFEFSISQLNALFEGIDESLEVISEVKGLILQKVERYQVAHYITFTKINPYG